MKVMVVPAGAFLVNTLLVWDEESKEAMIVDPGSVSALEEIEDKVQQEGLQVRYIVNTHEHPDHIAANAWAKLKFPEAKLIMHPKAAEDLNYWVESEIGEMAGAEYSPPPDFTVEDGNKVVLGKKKFEVIYAPGHSPGSIVLYSPDDNMAIVGDLIFKGSIGRYDLPKSSYEELRKSILRVLSILKEDTVVFPGHGLRTTVREEINNNPFIREMII